MKVLTNSCIYNFLIFQKLIRFGKTIKFKYFKTNNLTQNNYFKWNFNKLINQVIQNECQ